MPRVPPLDIFQNFKKISYNGLLLKKIEYSFLYIRGGGISESMEISICYTFFFEPWILVHLNFDLTHFSY